jgi:hypothetical protein
MSDKLRSRFFFRRRGNDAMRKRSVGVSFDRGSDVPGGILIKGQSSLTDRQTCEAGNFLGLGRLRIHGLLNDWGRARLC